MASITTNGFIGEIPYAILRNIRNARPWTMAVKGRDKRAAAYNQQHLRTIASSSKRTPDIFVYVGDIITVDLAAPANATDAAIFDFYSVNFTTGAETKTAEVGFNQVWQRQVKVTITAINSSTGAITFTTQWS